MKIKSKLEILKETQEEIEREKAEISAEVVRTNDQVSTQISRDHQLANERWWRETIHRQQEQFRKECIKREEGRQAAWRQMQADKASATAMANAQRRWQMQRFFESEIRSQMAARALYWQQQQKKREQERQQEGEKSTAMPLGRYTYGFVETPIEYGSWRDDPHYMQKCGLALFMHAAEESRLAWEERKANEALENMGVAAASTPSNFESLHEEILAMDEAGQRRLALQGLEKSKDFNPLEKSKDPQKTYQSTAVLMLSMARDAGYELDQADIDELAIREMRSRDFSEDQIREAIKENSPHCVGQDQQHLVDESMARADEEKSQAMEKIAQQERGEQEPEKEAQQQEQPEKEVEGKEASQEQNIRDPEQQQQAEASQEQPAKEDPAKEAPQQTDPEEQKTPEKEAEASQEQPGKEEPAQEAQQQEQQEQPEQEEAGQEQAPVQKEQEQNPGKEATQEQSSVESRLPERAETQQSQSTEDRLPERADASQVQRTEDRLPERTEETQQTQSTEDRLPERTEASQSQKTEDRLPERAEETQQSQSTEDRLPERAQQEPEQQQQQQQEPEQQR